MATLTGDQLAQNIQQRIIELKKVCEGVAEDTASRAPTGRWSPKEILSHLLGPEGSNHLLILQSFINHETPVIDIEAENPFFSKKRAGTPFAKLLAEVEMEYGLIAEFAAGLPEDHLDRRAQIPMLKDTPFGEYPTLATWIGLLGGMEGSHLQFHTEQMREILQALGASGQ